jgi:hypothetical protein
MATAELRARLRELQFVQPLGNDSVALVRALVDSLVDARGRLGELGARTDAHSEELRLAQSQVHLVLLATKARPGAVGRC